LKDGESFGELAVIDNNKVGDEHSRTQDSNTIKKKPSSTNKRLATCKTIEKSRMIRIPAAEARRIVQPTLKKEQEYSTASI